jgi:FtsX-like permease family
VTTVFMLLASLVAAAGFAVVAQRRLRQLGMFAAVGATEKQLRLVLIANGAIVGVIAAVAGTVAGLIGWVLIAPTLESAVDHRIDRLSLPWWLIAGTVILAILGATAAAWWPGRAAARLPVVLALSDRPPEPRQARHSAVAAAASIAVGVGCLALSDRERTALIVAGIFATILGSLLLWPPAIRIFSRLAGGCPSHRASPSATLPGTRSGRERRSQPSRSHSASRRRSSSSRPRRRRRRRASRPPCPPTDPRLPRPGRLSSTHPARNPRSTLAPGRRRPTPRRATRPGDGAPTA